MSNSVLVITNDKVVKHTTIDALHKAGYRVHSASDNYHAMEILRNHSIDLLLLEPLDSTYHRVLAFIHDTPMLLHIPIIMILSSESECNKIGAPYVNGYITKPFSSSMLITTVERWLRVKAA